MYTFRIATPEDADALVRIRTDFMSGYDRPMGEADYAALANYRAFLLDGMRDGSYVMWLAETGGEIVATGSASFYRLPPIAGRPNGWEAYVGNMFTYPAHRRQGLAGEILRLLAEEARAAGCGAVTLHATKDGRPLYERFGFADAADMMRFPLER